MSPENDNQSSLEIPTPIGPIKTRGNDVIITIGVSILILMMYLVYDIKRENSESHATITKAITIQSETNAEMIYMLSRTPEQLKALDIDMPVSLRSRLSNRR